MAPQKHNVGSSTVIHVKYTPSHPKHKKRLGLGDAQ
jgi:hypothetical protein